MTEETPNLEAFQKRFVQNTQRITGWKRESADKTSLFDVIHNVAPTVLIGVSGQADAFGEALIREMAKGVERPIIFPLSNPTSCVEAQPADLVRWTNGRAIIGTGSPFASFEYEGRTHHFAQTNNSYIFPGVGLAAIATNARRVTDGMFLAAARALAELSPARKDPTDKLLPPLATMREVSQTIAFAVAQQARAEGLLPRNYTDGELKALIAEKTWQPVYRSLV